MVKEEGDTSQVSQAYGQMVAKEDKRYCTDILDTVKMHMKISVCQWQLVCVVNTALNEVEKKDGLTEFIHPCQRMSITARSIQTMDGKD